MNTFKTMMTLTLLLGLSASHPVFAMDDENIEEGSTHQPPSREMNADELRKKLERLRLEREIEEEESRLAEAKSKRLAAKAKVAEQGTGKEGQNRVAHNAGKEAEKGLQSASNFLKEGKWITDKKLQKKQEKKEKKKLEKEQKGE